MNDQQLRRAIEDLAAIEQNGQLSELQIAFAEDCRAAGGRPDAKTRRKLTDFDTSADVDAIARAAAEMFGESKEKCAAIAREAVTQDPWSVIALDIIKFFKSQIPPAPQWGQDGAEPPAAPSKPRRRKW